MSKPFKPFKVVLKHAWLQSLQVCPFPIAEDFEISLGPLIIYQYSILELMFINSSFFFPTVLVL